MKRKIAVITLLCFLFTLMPIVASAETEIKSNSLEAAVSDLKSGVDYPVFKNIYVRESDFGYIYVDDFLYTTEATANLTDAQIIKMTDKSGMPVGWGSNSVMFNSVGVMEDPNYIFYSCDKNDLPTSENYVVTIDPGNGLSSFTVYLNFILVDKYPVQILGIQARNAFNKAGTPVLGYSGIPQVVREDFGSDITEFIGNLDYVYQGLGDTVYDANSNPPEKVGEYQLTISVPKNNEIYEGSVVLQFEIFSDISLEESSFYLTNAASKNYMEQSIDCSLKLVTVEEGTLENNQTIPSLYVWAEMFNGDNYNKTSAMTVVNGIDADGNNIYEIKNVATGDNQIQLLFARAGTYRIYAAVGDSETDKKTFADYIEMIVVAPPSESSKFALQVTVDNAKLSADAEYLQENGYYKSGTEFYPIVLEKSVSEDITVQFVDEDGNAVKGYTVQIQPNTANEPDREPTIILDKETATTNVLGEITFKITAGTVAGKYKIYLGAGESEFVIPITVLPMVEASASKIYLESDGKDVAIVEKITYGLDLRDKAANKVHDKVSVYVWAKEADSALSSALTVLNGEEIVEGKLYRVDGVTTGDSQIHVQFDKAGEYQVYAAMYQEYDASKTADENIAILEPFTVNFDESVKVVANEETPSKVVVSIDGTGENIPEIHVKENTPYEVVVQFLDKNGNVVPGYTVALNENSKTITLDKQEATTNANGELSFTFTGSIEGDYSIYLTAGTNEFEVPVHIGFDYPVELVLEYPGNAALGDKVSFGKLYWLDAYGIDKEATGIKFQTEGDAVSALDAATGDIVVKHDAKYFGDSIKVIAVDEKYNLTDTTKIDVVYHPAVKVTKQDKVLLAKDSYQEWDQYYHDGVVFERSYLKENESLEFTAQFMTEYGKPLQGKDITIDTNSANITVEQNADVTNAAGEMEFTVTGSGEGSYNIYLSVDGNEYVVPVHIGFVTPTEIVLEYPEYVKLGETVLFSELYYLDAYSNKKAVDLSNKGIVFAAKGDAVETFNTETGELTVKKQKKYDGEKIEVTVADERFNLVDTFTITVDTSDSSGSSSGDSSNSSGNNNGSLNSSNISNITVTTPDSNLDVNKSSVGNSVVKEATQVVEKDSTAEVIGDKNCSVSISAKSNGDAVHAFDNPLTVSVPVSDKAMKDVTDTSKLTLAKVTTDENGETVITYVGGNYNPETGEFEAYVNEPGDYILVEDSDIQKIELQVGESESAINGEAITNDVAPLIHEGRTMVPVRFIAETLGAQVDWNESSRTITLTIDGVAMEMTIDETIEGFDGAPMIHEGRTMVPIRYIAEKLGAHIIWVPDTQEIVIVK